MSSNKVTKTKKAKNTKGEETKVRVINKNGNSDPIKPIKSKTSPSLLRILISLAAAIGFFFLAKFGVEYFFQTEITFSEPFFVTFGVVLGLGILWKIADSI